SAETSSAALLSWVEVISSRWAAARTLVSTLSTDPSNRTMVAAISSPRCSRSRLAAGWLPASGSPPVTGVGKAKDGPRHRAQFVLGLGGRDADRGIARRQPLHRLGQLPQRPRDAATDPPAECQ